MELIKYFITTNGMEVAHSYSSPSSRKMSDSQNRLLFSRTGKYILNIILAVH